MQNLIPLLLSADYATDENGFLYKMRSGKYRPLRPEMPRFSNPDNKRLYFKVKLNGQYVTFSQDDLKRNQQKAIARVCQ